MDARARLRAALLARRKRRGVPGGSVPRPRRGEGLEFVELREYVPGDDPRRIDWAATARAGMLQTRVFDEERAVVLAALIDASGSMRIGRARAAYDIARDAVRMWYGLAAADDRCVRVLSDGVVRDIRRRGAAAAQLCSDARTEPALSLTDSLRQAVAVLPRDAFLLVVSDFYDLQEALPTLCLLEQRCDVTALIVRDAWHDGLPVGGFVRVRDAESGDVRRLYVGAAERRRFAAAVGERESVVRQALEKTGIRCAVLAEAPESALAEAFALA